MKKDRKCRFCKTLFKDIGGRAFGGHAATCRKNPNYFKNKKKKRTKLIKTFIEKNGELKQFKVNCHNCKKELIVNEREKKFPEKDKYFCSKKCANKRVIKGNKLGKCNKCGKPVELDKRTNLKAYICINCRIIKKNCVICKKEFGTLNKNVETCSLKCSSKLGAQNHDKDFGNKISKTRKKMFKDGKIKVTGGTTKWYQYKDIKVQGTFELRTCKILDSWKEKGKILKWEYTNDRFEYIGIDGNKHTYLLDFKIFESNNEFYYVEVKGFKIDNDDFKWKAVKDAGYKIEVWFLNTINKHEKELLVK